MEIVLVSVQDRSKIYTKHSIASETDWTYPLEHLGDMGHVESCFDPFGDSVGFGA
jgi:hypothetical protein